MIYITRFVYPLLAAALLCAYVFSAISQLRRGLDFSFVMEALAFGVIVFVPSVFLVCRSVQAWRGNSNGFVNWASRAGAANVFAAMAAAAFLLFGIGTGVDFVTATFGPSPEERAQQYLNDENLEYPDLPYEAPPDRGPYDWKFLNLEGEEVSMSAYAGKVLLLNRWATWCGPCRAEMPSLQALYEELEQDERIAFAFVSNEDVEIVRKFATENGYTFPLYAGAEEDVAPEDYATNSIPYTVILSPEGEVVFKHRGWARWDTEKTIDFLRGLAAPVGK